MTNTTTATTSQLESLQQRYEALERENAELKKQVKLLLEQLRLARHRQFGKSSERTTDDQVRLDLVFNEAEAEAQPEAEEPTFETVTYQRRKKQPGQRDAMLAGLPVERIEYHVPEEGRNCPCCGEVMDEVGVESVENSSTSRPRRQLSNMCNTNTHAGRVTSTGRKHPW